MSALFEIRVGSTFAYDGGMCTVAEYTGDAVVVVDSGNRFRRIRMVDLLRHEVDGGMTLPTAGGGPAEEPLVLVWADATEADREEAHVRAEHVREVETGYRSGTPAVKALGEPRDGYDPSRTRVTDRLRAKAAELGVQPRTISRWRKQYAEAAELGLVDRRKTRLVPSLSRLDPRWVDMWGRIVDEQIEGSKLSTKVLLGRVAKRLDREYGADVVRVPSNSAAYAAAAELERGRGTLKGSRKAHRSIENRPPAPYRRFRATRPGEYVLLDSTPLNVFAIEPLTGRWTRVELTIAMCLYDRSILGLRLAPVSTKAVDVAGVLMEAMQPLECPPEWGTDAIWPYHGVATEIVYNSEHIDVGRFQRLGIVPETIVVDHGKPFMSEHVLSVCQRLGISVQPAHFYTGTDKPQVERFFRTIEPLLQELPGYKGSDVASRGLGIEDEAVYTIPQLEQIIREWIATVYHLRPHAGLVDPRLPGIEMSPAQRYAQGVAVAGMIRVPANPHLVLEMLPVVRRKFNHYGVEVAGLRYNGDPVGKYHDRSRSLKSGKSQWSFSINPDDMSRIYFNDPEDHSWHTLMWEHHESVPVPFSLDALEYARQLALESPEPRDVEGALVRLLERWGVGGASNPTERRISARLAAQLAEPAASTIGLGSLHTVRTLAAQPTTPPQPASPELAPEDLRPAVDPLEADDLDLDDFYREALGNL